MDKAGLSAAGDAVQEVPPPVRNTAICIPRFGGEEVLRVGDEHVLDSWLEDHRREGALFLGAIPPPARALG